MHDKLFLQSEVKWLQEGKFVKQLVELKVVVHKRLQDSGSILFQHFLDKKCLSHLSHMSDVFNKLNRLSCSIQGPVATVFQFFDKVSSFVNKTMLWKSVCESDTLEMFVSMNEYIEEMDFIF
jgi:hypothetical protein